jgi:hypothetical protein
MKVTSTVCLRAYQPLRLFLDDQRKIPDRFDSPIAVGTVIADRPPRTDPHVRDENRN